jgi:hypothetical protein
MPEMTEKEADALDDLVTRNPPKVDPSKARRLFRVVELDDFSADYLLSLSAASDKSPTQLIGEMVRERATS